MTTEQQTTVATTTTTEGAGGNSATAQQTTGVQAQQQTTQTTATQEAVKTGAPETYTFTAPEGKEYSPEMVGVFSDAAKAGGLTQEAAQKVLEKLAPAMEAQQIASMEKMRNAWAEELKADKELGGTALEENLAVAKSFIDKFGDDELKALLEETGLGNHRALARAFFKAGKAISEDRIVSASSGSGSTQSIAQTMFPGMNP